MKEQKETEKNELKERKKDLGLGRKKKERIQVRPIVEKELG